MVQEITTVIKKLESRYPSINAFVLKFELIFMTLLFRPEYMRVSGDLGSVVGKIDIQISELCLELLEQVDRVNLGFKMTITIPDGSKQISLMQFYDVAFNLYQIREIAELNEG